MTATLIPFPTPLPGSAGVAPASRGRGSRAKGSSGRGGLAQRQKALLHIYKQAAGLAEAEYRQILVRSALVATAADPRF
jgi:hypothetical protein